MGELDKYRAGAADWVVDDGGRLTPGSAMTTGKDTPGFYDERAVAAEILEFQRRLGWVVPDRVGAFWAKWPGSDAHYINTALDMVMPLEELRAMGADDTLDELTYAYDRLGGPIRAALWLEWSLGKESQARMLDDRTLEDWWRTPEGHLLKKVWGVGIKADRRASAAVAKIAAIKARLTPRARQELDEFISSLSPHALACALCTLA